DCNHVGASTCCPYVMVSSLHAKNIPWRGPNIVESSLGGRDHSFRYVLPAVAACRLIRQRQTSVLTLGVVEREPRDQLGGDLFHVCLSETHTRMYRWCSPPKTGTANV